MTKPLRMKQPAARVADDDQVVLDALAGVAGRQHAAQMREPKRIHPFPARMPVSVAKHIIDGVCNDDALVLDPMVGSGTTLIAALSSGHRCLGFDRDLLAVRIARSATSTFNIKSLHALSTEILDRAKRHLTRQAPLDKLRHGMQKEDQAFLEFWFPSWCQKELFALSRAIKELPSGPEQDIAWVVFSSLIIAKSAGVSRAIDISRSRPHRRTGEPDKRPFGLWSQRFNAIKALLQSEETGIATRCTVRQGDARKLPLNAATVDMAITSPPYRNAVDYLRAHKFSLVWMGHTLSELRELRGTMIGCERGLWQPDGLPTAVERKLLKRQGEARQIALTRRYLADVRLVMTELHRVLRPKGLAVLVVGPTVINRRRSDSARVLSEIAADIGFGTVGSVVRELSAERRSLPPPVQLRPDSPLSERMRREIILALRK